jgi:hypothetical protein
VIPLRAGILAVDADQKLASSDGPLAPARDAFPDAAAGDSKEVAAVRFSGAAVALGHAGGYRKGGAVQLVGQEEIAAREGGAALPFSSYCFLFSPALFFRLKRKNRGDTIRTCDFLVPNQAL